MRIVLMIILTVLLCASARAQLVAVNAADLSPQLAPGSVGLLVFADFGVVGELQADSLPLPVTLGGVSVRIDGQPAPLFRVTMARITFQVPIEARPGLAEVEVVRPDGKHLTSKVYLTPQGPALFRITVTPRANDTVLVVLWATGIQIDRCPHIQVQAGQAFFTPLFVGATEYVGVQQLNFLLPKALVTGIPNNNLLRVDQFTSSGFTLSLNQ